MSIRRRMAAQSCRCQLVRYSVGRSFSTSSPWRRKGELASFPPTSSRELDDILHTFYSRVFVPNHVSKAYRNMIYKPSQQYHLTGEEPVMAILPVRRVLATKPTPDEPELEEAVSAPAPAPAPAPAQDQDQSKVLKATAPPIYPQKKPQSRRETILLNPLNRNTDEPKTRSQYLKMLDLMATETDFGVVPEFLRELRLSNRVVTASMLAKTVRRGAELNCTGRVIDMFRQIGSVGVSMSHPYVLTELLLGAISRASRVGWAQEDLDKVLRQVDMVFKMAEDPRHDIKWPVSERFDGSVMKLPHLWGTAMSLEAVRAIRYGRREFGHGDTRGLVPRAVKFAELYNESMLESSQKWSVQNEWLVSWTPSFHGSKFAIEVLGADSDLGRRLQRVLETLEPAVLKSMQIVEDGVSRRDFKRGLKMFQDMEQAPRVESVTGSLREAEFIVETAEGIDNDGLFGASEATEGERPEKSASA